MANLLWQKVLNFIIIILVFLAINKYFLRKGSEYSNVISPFDGQSYIVRNLPDKETAAENLGRIRKKLNIIVEYMTNKYSNESRVNRLQKNYREDAISESPANSKHTSYSVNKGEKIYFCLRQRDENDRLVDLNTVTFVALHELSHLMTKSIGHTQEFWDNFRFLLEEAIKIGIYKYQDFHLRPVSYCGTMITDTPLKL